MAHKSQEALKQVLQAATQAVEVGAIYTHYKRTELFYKVVGLVILEATDEPAVLYEAQYGEHITFARPLSSWRAEVAYDGEVVPRFAKVADK